MYDTPVIIAAALAIGGISLCVMGALQWYRASKQKAAWSAIMRGDEP